MTRLIARERLSVDTNGRIPMRIREVTITAGRLEDAVTFYRDVLQMPVDEEPERVAVKIGASLLIVEQGDQFDGVHHLAFGISPQDFDLAVRWLNQRVEPIVVGDSEVIDGPEGWHSQSLYFLGPENILLEFIARQSDAEIPRSDGAIPGPLSISEVGIGVPKVEPAVQALADRLGLPAFPPQEEQFAPVGDHEGLLIVADHERVWFPTREHRAARGPLAVRIEAPDQANEIALTQDTRITAFARSDAEGTS